MKRHSLFDRISGSPYVVWSLMFIIAPLLFVLYFAFTDRNGSFTLENILSLSSYSETFVMSLGFSRSEASLAVGKLEKNLSLDDMIKQALLSLSGNL